MTQKFLASVVVSYLLIACSMAPAGAQVYVPAPNFAYPIAPNYTSPAPPIGYNSLGLDWRDTRGGGDWRNNTWREETFDEDWRNRNWQTRRELRDWREREDIAKRRTPDNPFERGYVECGQGAAGMSFPCYGSTNYGLTKKSDTADDYQKAGDGYEYGGRPFRQRAVARGVENCGHLSVWRRC
jgi:hypothetical protein